MSSAPTKSTPIPVAEAAYLATKYAKSQVVILCRDPFVAGVTTYGETPAEKSLAVKAGDRAMLAFLDMPSRQGEAKLIATLRAALADAQDTINAVIEDRYSVAQATLVQSSKNLAAALGHK